ncbi:MAG: ECF transporter S component [Candidatus Paraimprobicoccus trichonymphae]|uniref:ECF transporter S component n=1 Tax=Candidatus Paraimprobicoccus trichonymphae TaxID=3033793 RepID=A0AA48KZJ5_9FIRM|nr:MAG: ECF transporter S component [Candidatus Paraimprobicoccus trichonymphae]
MSAVSLMFSFFIKIPVIPSLPFLRLEFSDCVIFLASGLFGIKSGILVLLVTQILRFLLLSTLGLVGLVVHLCAVVLVIVFGILKKIKKLNQKIFLILTGILISVLIKVPLNNFFIINFLGMQKETLNKILFPVIMFNVLKDSINCALAVILILFVTKNLKLCDGYGSEMET